MNNATLRGVLCALLSVVHADAHAQAYPTKSIRLVLPFAAGGSTDILARTLSVKWGENLRQTIIIDNRGGGGGNIGAVMVAKAAPDGYTVLLTTSGVVTVNPSLYTKLDFNPQKDFAPVSIIAALPNLLVVHPTLPVKSVAELIGLAKSKSGHLTFASGGSGTSNHLAGELFKVKAGVELTHVPYKGGGPAVIAVLSNEVTMLFATLPSAVTHVKAGRLKAIAVTSSKRAGVLPEIATVSESGLPGFEVSLWIGVMVPTGTPVAIIDRLNAEARRAVQSPDVSSRLIEEGYEIIMSTPAAMAATIAKQTAEWERVVRTAGIRAD